MKTGGNENGKERWISRRNAGKHEQYHETGPEDAKQMEEATKELQEKEVTSSAGGES